MRVLLGDPPTDEDPTAVYAVDRPPVGDRPWVFANMVAGLDGAAAFEGRTRALSSPCDRALFFFLRSLADMVLVGAGTVRAERYGPVRLAPEVREAREARGQEALPRLAVVSRSLTFDWGSRLFADETGPRPIVLTAAAAPKAALAEARDHADVVIAGDDSVDLRVALADLHQRGAAAVLTEGGPTLLGGLVTAGLLDELCLTLAPAVGGDPLAIAEASGPRSLVPFELASVLEEDGNLFLRYLAPRTVP